MQVTSPVIHFNKDFKKIKIEPTIPLVQPDQHYHLFSLLTNESSATENDASLE